MREQEAKFKDLLAEFKALKEKLFGASFFRVMETDTKKVDPDEQRYDVLLGFFYPQFRTVGWQSPLGG